MEQNQPRLSAADVKKRVSGLMERRSWLQQGAEPPTIGYNPAQAITRDFEELASQTGVSVAALEFLHNPVGLVGRGATDLTRVENVFEDLNVQWAEELKKANLI